MITWISGQAFSHYENWECYKNGMYKCVERHIYILKAKSVLESEFLFSRLCKKVISDWKISSTVNLSNKIKNRKAYLGASACCIKFLCSEIETCNAWWMLTDQQRKNANLIAQKEITLWEHLTKEICRKQNNQSEFQF
jgi:hypothetical protein